MTSIVPRTVTVVADDTSPSEPLAEFRSAQAYVLLGDPGAGKTEAFRREHAAHADSEFLTARRFVRLSLRRVADMKRKTLFIDGLDEARVGSPDPRRPLDHILERLDYLGNPRFRLSCRAADWLGRNDLTEIVAEAGYQDTRVLHLDPLTDSDIRRMLTDQGVSDVRAFLIRARDRDLDGLLDNPQLLGLLAKATRMANGPKTEVGSSSSRVASLRGNGTSSTAQSSRIRPRCLPTGSFPRLGTCRRFSSCRTGGECR